MICIINNMSGPDPINLVFLIKLTSNRHDSIACFIYGHVFCRSKVVILENNICFPQIYIKNDDIFE
jgi:hypothetical protein